MTSLGLCSFSDIITFDQNGPEGKDLSNDAQMRVIGPMEPEICPKMIKKLSGKLATKFPTTTQG